jgi:hypothetical protein
MKNTLAENLLRFKAKNLTEYDVLKLNDLSKHLIFEGAEWISVTAPNISVAFAAGATDSSPFINTVWTQLKSAIDANPEAKALYNAKNLALQSMKIYAGASNNYNNTPTQYDTGNYDSGNNLSKWGKADRSGKGGTGYAAMYNTALLAKKGVNTKFTDADMQTGYTANLALANNRGLNIATNLKTTMVANGITIPDTKTGQYYNEIIMPGVIDTGGYLDASRNKTDSPYPGQMATIVVELSGKQAISTVPVSMATLVAGIKDKSITWGSYKNAATGDEMPDSFELKYFPGQGKGQDTRVTPVVRWVFTYDQIAKTGGKITKIEQINFSGKDGIPGTIQTSFPNKIITLNPAGKKSMEKQIPDLVQILKAAGMFDIFFTV